MPTSGNRVVARDPTSDLLAMAMMIYSLPRVPVHADALVVFNGLGEMGRTLHALQWWQHPTNRSRFLLLAGSHPDEHTAEILTLERLRTPPFNVQRLAGVQSQLHASHTKAQAEWVAERIDALGITSLALFVSSYHLLRAYLTLLKTLLGQEITVPMSPMPTPMSPATVVPEIGVAGWRLVPGECQRIQTYQARGYIASFAELLDYVRWVWHQPLFAEPLGDVARDPQRPAPHADRE
jgi:hypothetical protein